MEDDHGDSAIRDALLPKLLSGEMRMSTNDERINEYVSTAHR